MRPGTHAAGDGSFGRSAGAAMGRGVVLLAIALVIGIVLLNATEDQPPGADLAAGSNGARTENGASVTSTTAVTTTTTTPVRAPADVKVLVANASDVKGAAGTAKDRLVAAKYNALSPANSAATATSAVYFTAGYEAEAKAIATALEIPVSLVKALPTPPPTDPKTANVVVILGADHAGRFAAATSASTTTTAQAAATASTTTTTR